MPSGSNLETRLYDCMTGVVAAAYVLLLMAPFYRYITDDTSKVVCLGNIQAPTAKRSAKVAMQLSMVTSCHVLDGLGLVWTI